MIFRKTLTAVAITAAMATLSGCQLTTDAEATTSQQATINYPSVKIPYQKFTLDNGLTVIVHEDHKTPIVAVNVWYKVGSKDEKPGKTGFAHLFEHLMFNGSENYDDEYFGPFEKAGATEMNGTTNNDRTNYFENVPTPALDMALWMESDRMGHLVGAITQSKLDEQRGVVQNEKRQGEAQPYGRVFGYIAKNTFPSEHPYSWPVIGSMDDLNAASLDDVKQWFSDYYGAANAVLVMAGDIDVETAKAKAQKYFGDIPAGKPLKKLRHWVAKRSGEKRAVMEDNVPAARLYKVWNTAASEQQDAVLLGMFADILGNGKNSRLYKRLVEQEQLVSSVNVMQYNRDLAGQFFIIADAKQGVSLDKIEAIIDQEKAKLIAEGPSVEELQRLKFADTASFVRRAETIGGFGGKSDILASGEVYQDNPGFYQQRLEWLQNATPAAVTAAAKQWLSDGAFVLQVKPQPNYETHETSVDRSKLPEVGKLPKLDLPKLQSFTLSNGLPVYLAERHDTPTVEMTMNFKAGYAADPLSGAPLGTASFTLQMLEEGTKQLSSSEFAAKLDRLGSQLSTSDSLDESRINVSALTVNLPETLELLDQVLTQPGLRDEDIERVRSLWLESIRKEKAQPRSQAIRLLPQLLFGNNHPYGQPLTGSGTLASIKKLTKQDIEQHLKHWIRPDNARLVVVGDTDVTTLKPLLEKSLGQWQAPAVAIPSRDIASVPAQKQAHVYLIDQPGSPQATIIAGQIAPSKATDNATTIDVMNTIMGGAFSARLNMNLREDKHWSYGAYSMWLSGYEGPGMWLAFAPVQADKAKESTQEIYQELHQYVGAKPATAEELAKVKANEVAKLPGAYEDKASLLSAIRQALSNNKDMSYLENEAQRIESIPLEDVQQAANTVLHPDSLTWVIIGDLDKIEQQIRAAGIGEVTVVDPDEID
ncbi:peptidase M16 [Idiomarina tyrosinivorans]|uniref:Peptidase M16 n=1 Tax=Idiomarina tyrosinivorans TaxID=1445662 RepID=A0A432ZUI9_9GAMM|nr:pitrilysin family protein [Idiomarina tyrosinivorans]RUO81521.1 peptidase M16 [Idiomarina tyrosinivorans]